MILLIIAYLLLLYVEIFGEVIFGDKHNLKSYLILTVTLLLASAMGLLAGVWYGIAIYLGIRVLLFDISFGYLFKNDMWYLGTTSPWDIVKRKLINKMKNIIKKVLGLGGHGFLTVLAVVFGAILVLAPVNNTLFGGLSLFAGIAALMVWIVKK